MAERMSYVPGTPCWVDLGTPDVKATADFYGEIFGWTAEIDPRPEAGGYGMFKLRDRLVAGLGPQMSAGPPFWAVYVSVADIDQAAARVTAQGGTLVAGPMDVFDAGRMAVAQDILGSFISIWEPKAHIGAQLVNEPGAFTWNELATADLDRTRKFYTSVFDWAVSPDGDPARAAIFTVGGNMVCGAHAAGPDEPPFWSVWFAVEDCEKTAAQAAELGASVLMPPGDMDFGRGSVLADPQGAAFGIGSVKPELVQP